MAIRIQEAASLPLDEIYRYSRDRWGEAQADMYITGLFAAFEQIETRGQVHGAAADGSVVFRKKLSRPQFTSFMVGQSTCQIAMEACPSAHHWARELTGHGHRVRLIAPHCVKPFLKRQKKDAADAEAIVEEALRPTMRFVEPKSTDQQARAVAFRTREQLVKQRTESVNALRSDLTELKNRGIAAILIAVVVGLKGFPDAITAIIPQTVVQTCNVRLIRTSISFACWKDRKDVARELRAVNRVARVRGAQRLRGQRTGPAIPADRPELTPGLGARCPVFRLPRGRAPNHLHHGCDRIAELQAETGGSDARPFPE